jgi:segregation and condensation protein A
MLKEDHFTLPNFEGTLDFLICLIRKEEIEIYDVPIQDLIAQFIDRLKKATFIISSQDAAERGKPRSKQSGLNEEGMAKAMPDEEDRSGEAAADRIPDEMMKVALINHQEGFVRGTAFIEAIAYLVWLKSKMLLPSSELSQEVEEAPEDPQFEIIHHLIDYCRFKRAAKELSSIQEKQQAYYFRGIEIPEWKKPLGIDHVSLEELSQLFKEMMSKAIPSKSVIEEESWRLCDKIRMLRQWLKERPSFLFTELFFPQQSRLEMIVIFLAVLELMKTGEITAGRDQTTTALWIFAKERDK